MRHRRNVGRRKGPSSKVRFTVCPVLGPHLVYNVHTWQLEAPELPD